MRQLVLVQVATHLCSPQYMGGSGVALIGMDEKGAIFSAMQVTRSQRCEGHQAHLYLSLSQITATPLPHHNIMVQVIIALHLHHVRLSQAHGCTMQ